MSQEDTAGFDSFAGGLTAGGVNIEGLFCDPSLGGQQVPFGAGAVVHEEDTPATDLFYVHMGQVRVLREGRGHATMLLEILGAGGWFGSAALAGVAVYGTRAVTVGATTVTRVPAPAVAERASASPTLARELIRQIAIREQAACDEAARLVFDDCHSRLITTLVRFAGTAAATPREGGTGIVLRITHQQLAQAVGVARETVSLALTQLRRQNVVRTGRNQLFFDPDVLRKFAAARGRDAGVDA